MSNALPDNVKQWPLAADVVHLQTALEAAFAVGAVLRTGFSSEYKKYVKEDQSEFTPLDEEAEALAVSIIRKKDSDAVVMSEELTPDEDVADKDFWVIDGLDGTTNFTRRIPIVNFTMAYVERGRAIIGVVYNFLGNKLYYAVEGQGAYINGSPVRVIPRSFKESLITFAPLLHVRPFKDQYGDELVDAVWKGMREISQTSGRFHREFQSGALELSWVACGKLDGFVSSWTNPWDLSAGALMVTEAGGVATNILGEAWRPSRWGVVAGSPEIHAAILPILQKHFVKKLRANGRNISDFPQLAHIS